MRRHSARGQDALGGAGRASWKFIAIKHGTARQGGQGARRDTEQDEQDGEHGEGLLGSRCGGWSGVEGAIMKSTA